MVARNSTNLVADFDSSSHTFVAQEDLRDFFDQLGIGFCHASMKRQLVKFGEEVCLPASSVRTWK